MYQFKLEKFEGPLDLLLELIEKEKFDITEVSLSIIADQYLEYIESNPKITANNLVQFLIIASQLLFLKSKALVPGIADEEEEDLEELQKRLALYQRYRKMVQVFDGLIKKGEFFIARKYKTRIKIFCPPKNFSALDLQKYYFSFLQSEDYIAPIRKEKLADSVSIQEKINLIKNALKRKLKIKFSSLKQSSRIEIIVSFLAILELVKTEKIFLSQEEIFGEILINRRDKTLFCPYIMK